MGSEFKFKYKAKITDDLHDAHEIVRNVGRTILHWIIYQKLF